MQKDAPPSPPRKSAEQSCRCPYIHRADVGQLLIKLTTTDPKMQDELCTHRQRYSLAHTALTLTTPTKTPFGKIDRHQKRTASTRNHHTPPTHILSLLSLSLSLSHTHTTNSIRLQPRRYCRDSGQAAPLEGDKNHDRKLVVVGIHPSKRNPGPPPRQNEPERLPGNLAHSHFQKWPQNTLALSCLPVTPRPQLLAYTHFGRGGSQSSPPPASPRPFGFFPRAASHSLPLLLLLLLEIEPLLLDEVVVQAHGRLDGATAKV